MKYSAIPLAQTIVQLCQAKEIRHIVICPGSRNAPLTIGFTENPYFKTYSIVDERAAAFFALGISQQTGHPAAVVCTSGSAVLNFYPAIAESFYSDIPLVVISADRPADFIDIGDGQTIRQENVFANHILYSANLKGEASEQIYNETQINIALNTAIELNGPVHINAPFEEPLYHKTDIPGVRPQHVAPRSFVSKPIENLPDIHKQWKEARKILVLVGVLKPHSVERKYVEKLANNPRILVMTETTSNLSHEKFISSIDPLINSFTQSQKENFQPDLLLTFGGMVVSKKIKALLRDYKPTHHWHVDSKKAYDTYFSLTQHFKMRINDFFEEFLEDEITAPSDYQSEFLALKNYRLERHNEFCSQVSYSDFKVFDLILKALPENCQIQLSNSAVVRYSQLFSIKPGLEIYCNRGTSGIDGSTSTAIGSAVGSAKETVFITGDLSFLYDSNALWNNYIPKNFKIVIINNGGGGIFRILPGEKDTPNFDKYFETIHSHCAKHLAAMFGFLYTEISNETELSSSLNDFFREKNHPQILEIFTPRIQNDRVLKKYFEFLE